MLNCRVVVVFLAVMALAAGCAPPRNASLSINDAWARPGLAGGNSAVYLNIDNPSTNDDALLRADCDAAEVVEIHESAMDAEGTMQMHPQESVPIPAGAQVQFEPGGLHVMLVNLRQDLNEGDEITVTLQFENQGSMTVQAEVRQP